MLSLLQVEGIQKMDVRSFVLNPAEKGDSGETTFFEAFERSWTRWASFVKSLLKLCANWFRNQTELKFLTDLAEFLVKGPLVWILPEKTALLNCHQNGKTLKSLWVCIKGQGLRQHAELCLVFLYDVELRLILYFSPTWSVTLQVYLYWQRSWWGNSVEWQTLERLIGFRGDCAVIVFGEGLFLLALVSRLTMNRSNVQEANGFVSCSDGNQLIRVDKSKPSSVVPNSIPETFVNVRGKILKYEY